MLPSSIAGVAVETDVGLGLLGWPIKGQDAAKLHSQAVHQPPSLVPRKGKCGPLPEEKIACFDVHLAGCRKQQSLFMSRRQC